MEYEYKNLEFFNDTDTYMFKSVFREFESRVYMEKGYWWTTESLQYKATSILCKSI